jgi:hypothetical protein
MPNSANIRDKTAIVVIKTIARRSSYIMALSLLLPSTAGVEVRIRGGGKAG